MNSPVSTHLWFLERRQVCLPPRFYDDYHDRDLPAPKVQRMQGVSYWVSVDDPRLQEFLDDAVFYAEPARDTGLDLDPLLRRSAVTTRNRLQRARAALAGPNDPPPYTQTSPTSHRP